MALGLVLGDAHLGACAGDVGLLRRVGRLVVGRGLVEASNNRIADRDPGRRT
jgi:hypothetical protein